MKKILLTISILALLVVSQEITISPIQDDPIRPRARSAGLMMDEFRITNIITEDIEGFEDQLACLTMNIYYEARGESMEGQEAVAWVTLNRVASKHWRDSICGVVKQKAQFSWYKRGKRYKMHELAAVKDASIAARRVIENYVGGKDPTMGSDHYHNTTVNPAWAKSSKQTVVFGSHIFYGLY